MRISHKDTKTQSEENPGIAAKRPAVAKAMAGKLQKTQNQGLRKNLTQRRKVAKVNREWTRKKYEPQINADKGQGTENMKGERPAMSFLTSSKHASVSASNGDW
jgi:hypothetical protein